MKETFLLKEEHIKLLSRCYVQWQDCEAGAPEIDPKRPYGNSSVASDVAEILGLELSNEDEDGTEWDNNEAFEEALRFHRETETALQIILSTKTFKPGWYEKINKYPPCWKEIATPSSKDIKIGTILTGGNLPPGDWLVCSVDSATGGDYKAFRMVSLPATKNKKSEFIFRYANEGGGVAEHSKLGLGFVREVLCVEEAQ